MNAGRDFEQTVQWYPGHMAVAMRRIAEYVKLIDLVVEVVDGRVPHNGANPVLDTIAGQRPRLRVLSREDLADPVQTSAWLNLFAGSGRAAVSVDARSRGSIGKIVKWLAGVAPDAPGTQRILVVGLPNSGKSSVINGLVGRSVARTEDRAGVTRQLQWFRVAANLELMDTPGILVPRIESPDAQWKLALVGAVPRERYDPQDIALRFHRWLAQRSGGRTRVPDLETFAQARGFRRKGGVIDYHNAAQSYIKDFNEGKFGRITLEPAPGSANDDAKTA